MKRYVKASFGYYDNDWVDPPEDEYEREDGEIVINFKDVPCRVNDDGNEVQLTDYTFEDYYDPDYSNRVIEGKDLEDIFYSLMDWDAVPQKSGNYLFSGTLSVYYNEYVPIYHPAVYPRVTADDDEAYSELDYDGQSLSNVSFKAA